MARNTTRVGKSETLTIRLDPKTRFILEYVARLKGQTITTVVERAIVNSASSEAVRDPDTGHEEDWQTFWDVSDGARALKLTRRADFFPTYEEERRLAFCEEHWPFFFQSSNLSIFRYPFLNILWPRIDEFVEIHDQTKAGGDYWAAGRAMREAISSAGLAPPEWPVKKGGPAKTAAASSADQIADLDDDIPF